MNKIRIQQLVVFSFCITLLSCSHFNPQTNVIFEQGTSFTVDLGEHHFVKMIWVPKDSFLMGSAPGTEVRHDDEAQHKVQLSQGFWLSEFEITQKQWRYYMGSSIVAQQKKQYKHWRLRGVGDDLPMYFISWDDAIAFTEKLNQQVADRLPEGYKFSLPTEAQWEMAATVYANNADVPLTSIAWFQENSNKQVHPVGSKIPNKLGIYDLRGNLSEWCYDWYGQYPKQALTIDPVGPKIGELKIVRGGSWFGPAINTKATTRFKDPKQNGYSSLALRLALRPKNKNNQR